MSTLTPNYDLIKPGVNDPTDQDLWGGYLNDDLDIIDTVMKSISDVADSSLLPVGSLYFNATVNTNPATLLGYGTWVAFGAGRVILGAGSGTDINGEIRNFTATDTGGEYEHQLTVPELAAHTHDYLYQSGSRSTAGSGSTPDVQEVVATSPTGDDIPHNNIQPYIVVYIWVRTV
jgi:hypothetical protein